MPRRVSLKGLFPWLLIVLGLVGLLVAAGLFFDDRAHSPGAANIASEPAPSVAKPVTGEVEGYVVAPSLPRYVSIPSIGLGKARITHLGIGKGNQIASPDNVYDAGWYNASAKPGQAGAMFIYGHLSSAKTKGLFYDLKKLRPGDTVKVQRGDGQTYSYQVVSSKTYSHDQVDMNEVLAPVNANIPGLNLMTCAGKVIPGTNDFSERLVVFTKLSSS